MKSKRKKSPAPAAVARASWRGMVRFGLVAFPAEAFNAHSLEKDHVAFHQLHAECHSRIRYQKTCPIHGPVDNDEIVSGFEVSKGKYVEIDDDDLEKAKTDEERSVTIDAFVMPNEIDPFYLDGRMYFLSPDGSQARESYAVFLEALRAEERYGIGKVVLSGKEQPVLVRPYRNALLMMLLNFAAEMRDPDDVIAPVAAIHSTDKKFKLAKQLIESWTEPHLDFASYEDVYDAKIRAVIEDKIQGRETVTPQVDEAPDVINLADALRKSLRRSEKQPPTDSRRSGARRTSRRPAAKKRRA